MLSGQPTLGQYESFFPTSLIVADVENMLHRRLVRIGRTSYVLRTLERKRTSRKLSYGPKVGRPLDVTSDCDVLWTTLAEWVVDVRYVLCKHGFQYIVLS